MSAFGWMLAWGDLVWVPFTYTLQAYYLVDHAPALSPAATAGIVALNLAGYVLFRASNIQKHRFRRDPEAPLWGGLRSIIRTTAGSLLLTSGWWGIARHVNYLGDLLMALAWCLPTGFRHPLPLLLCRLHDDLAPSSRAARQCSLPREVRCGLERVLPEGPLADPSRSLLTWGSAGVRRHHRRWRHGRRLGGRRAGPPRPPHARRRARARQ